MKDITISKGAVKEIKRFVETRPLGIPERTEHYKTETQFLSEINKRLGEKRLIDVILSQYPDN